MPTTYSEIRYYLRYPADNRFRKSYGFSPPTKEMFGFGMTIHAGVGKLHELNPDAALSAEEARELAEQIFYLKHVPQSGDPAPRTVRACARQRRPDPRQLRHRLRGGFHPSAAGGVACRGSDPAGGHFGLDRPAAALRRRGHLIGAGVIDFKTMEGGEAPKENRELDWTELVLQVQLYALGAQEVHGEHARTGAVHLLKDRQRIDVPVDDEAVAAAVANVEWGVEPHLGPGFPDAAGDGEVREVRLRRPLREAARGVLDR